MPSGGNNIINHKPYFMLLIHEPERVIYAKLFRASTALEVCQHIMENKTGEYSFLLERAAMFSGPTKDAEDLLYKFGLGDTFYLKGPIPPAWIDEVQSEKRK